MYQNKGSYLILLFLKEPEEISTRGKAWSLETGYYLYIGSAMKSLSERVKRHLVERKKRHWHIDFLREKAEVVAVLLLPSEHRREEQLSRFVSNYGKQVPGFGATDCKTDSNLYKLESEGVERVFSSIVLIWRDNCDSVFE